jgi:DNA-directed RNA polymerase subunit RPC12/RpoP
MVVRLFITLVIAVVAAAVAMVFLGSLGQWQPGNPVIAVALGVVLLGLGLSAFRGLVRTRAPEPKRAPEEVSDLDVFFVCGECGTEFRVEKLGELQVPRHCGERMRVERRPATAPGLN